MKENAVFYFAEVAIRYSWIKNSTVKVTMKNTIFWCLKEI